MMAEAFHRTPFRHSVLLLLHLLLSLTPTLVHSQTRTMCLTQLSLASQACSLIPIERTHNGLGIVPIEDRRIVHEHHDHHEHDRDHEHEHEHEDEHTDAEHEHEHEDEHTDAEHEHEDEHTDAEHEHHNEGKGRRNHHRRRRHGTPQQETCCRWLKELDSACVCHTLLRLPRFLLRPHHSYTVSVADSCQVTFLCAGA